MFKMRVATLCATSFLLLSAASGEARQQVIINGSPADMQLPGLPGMGRQFKTGTARIRGRITAETGSPVRRAQVRIIGQEIASKTAMTDGDGRYEFRDLPAGRFTLSATKSGYVTVQYGQTRPFESGKPIELVDAQVLEKADISMPRGSVIAGRILDEFGDPVPDADVVAMRSVWSNGKRRLQPSGGRNSQTNDLGQFRLYGLPPGDYYVSATLRGGGDFMVMEMAMAATTGSGPAPSGSNPRSGYAPTYFPGTTSGAEAQKITLTAGQETQGTDFALLPVKLAKITGTVIGSDGKPVSGSMINAVPRGGGESAMFFGLGQGSARTDKNGNFTMNNVAPGDYMLQTRAIQITSTRAGDGGTMMFTARIGGPDGGGDAESGAVPVSISGEDLTNVIIVTSKGATATGKITYEGGTTPAATGMVRITAVPTDSDGGPVIGAGSTTAKADGTFEVTGLSGSRIFRVNGLPQGWILKAVEHNGADITDSGMEFKPGEAVTGLEIIATSKLTQVSGNVKAASGDPVKDYTVVIFSDEPQKWTAPMTRYVTGVRPDQDGRYQVKNLPAGGYYAIAVEYMAQGEWGDPEVLTRLRDKATKFSLDDGETKTVDLKLSGQ